MKKLLPLFSLLLVSMFLFMGQKSQDNSPRWNPDPSMTRIYTQGTYTPLPQNDNYVIGSDPRYTITPIGTFAVSANFRVHPSAGTQSETPITRHPSNQLIMLASANTFRGGSTFSTGVYVTTDGGVTWFGSDTLNNGGFSYGDPGPMIDKNGTMLMSYITTTGSMGASASTNNGINWIPTVTFPGASTSADKNLSGTDDAPSSAYYGRSYTVYTEFAGTYTNRIVLSYTTNSGTSWSTVAPVSPPTSTGHHHQGCDVRVGPNGEVYVVWANCTTNGQNSTEDSLGFAKSNDGGVTWPVAKNNANNMNGIRSAALFNSIRANGFPRIDVDRSGGPRNGWIYVVTAEKTVAPATDVADVILHKSTDGGNTWAASRVNQDAAGNGKYQYMPAVRVDEYGGVNIVFYDTRNTPTNDSAQVYVARSIDGGSSWSEILISDQKFKPKPISGLAAGYQGDYIGITSGNGKVWPYWAEDRTGIYQAWTAYFDIGPAITHTPLPNTEQLTGTYTVNCVITPAGSGINPSKTRLFWSRNNVSITDSVLMTRGSGNNWSAGIPANGLPATYRYYIKTTDSLNRVATAPAAAPASLYSFVASTDNQVPVITHTALTNQPKPVWPATVSATVTDNLGLDSVWVKWYKNSPSPIKQFKLINVGGSSFSAAFNSLNADVAIGDSIFYRIFAQDNSVGHNRDSTSLYKFKIIDQFLCEGFTDPAFPPTFWSLEYSGTQYWTRAAVSSFGVGSGSAKFDFWNASAGTVQSMKTLIFSNSVANDSIIFHVAYAPYTGSVDSLIIESSTNAGTTYSTLVQLWGSPSGGPLNTAPTQTGEFTPTSSQWGRRAYSVPVGTNALKFRAYSGFGNNLYLDSMCIGNNYAPPPVITSAPDSIVVNLPLGNNSQLRTLTLGNTGASSLSWSLRELNTLLSASERISTFTSEQTLEMANMPKEAKDKYFGPEVTDGAGGPDTYGYTWIDSDEPGGPAYNWFEISGIGTQITAWTTGTGDDGAANVTIPFNFPYYGTNYSQLKVCTNGWVSFDIASTSVAFSNSNIPATLDPNNALFALWDDLDVRTSGGIFYYYDAPNNRFVVQYNNVPHYSVGGPYTFQILLYTSGKIVYQYKTINTPDNSLSIGFENSTGTDGLQVVYNNTYVHNNLAILIEEGGLPWLTENPTSGGILSGGSQNVDVTFSSNGLAAGTYAGRLRIASNDPVTPTKDVRVRLNVGLAVPSTITLIPEAFYNAGPNRMNMKDTVTIYLRGVSSPYVRIDSAKGVIDSLTFTGSFLFSNAPTGTYYLQVKHRNSIETWSKSGGESFISGTPFSYNFTTAAAQSYGSNVILKGSKFCFYSGDVNQDGTIDGTDVGAIDNDAFNFATGYIATDVNGDGSVDGTDVSVADNNAFNFISKLVPPGAGPTKSTTDNKNGTKPGNNESNKGSNNETPKKAERGIKQ
jgi:hypothetical protein